MIKSAVSLRPNGQIEKVFLHASEELVEANTSIDDVVLWTVPPSNRSSYWDFDSESWIDIGDAPSEHHHYNYDEKRWVDPRPIDEIKAAKWNLIKLQRDILERSGFEFEGNVYDSDTTSQGRIVAAASLGVAVEWTLKDNSTIWLEPEQLKQLQIALAVHVTSVHARGKIAREAIYAASTVEEVEAVQF